MFNKRGQLDMEAFTNPAFFILCGVGYAAFAIMLIVLKGMGNSSIMPWWVKIVTIFVIPIVAYIFALFNSD